jgi:hypothetical protein
VVFLEAAARLGTVAPGGATRAPPKAQEHLLCDLIISAFSALHAVAEAASAVLAVDVDGDADDFLDDGSGFLGQRG